MKKQEMLKKIKEIPWECLVNRRETVFFRSLTDTPSPIEYFEEVTSLLWSPSAVLRLGEGEVLYHQQELQQLRKKIKQNGLPMLRSFAQKLRQEVKALDALKPRKDYSTVSWEVLRKDAEKYIAAALRAHKFLSTLAAADKALSEMIVQKFPPGPKEEWMGRLIFPQQENTHNAEEESFLHIVMASGKEREKMILEHLRQFSWIGARWGEWHNEWTTDTVLRRVQAYEASGKNPAKELEILHKVSQERQEEMKNLEQKLNISLELQELLNLAREFAYLRTWRTDVLYRANFSFRHVFYEIAQRAGIEKDDVIYFTHQEIMQMAHQHPVPVEELPRRKESSIMFTHGDELMVLAGQDIEEELRGFLFPKTREKYVEGMTAFPGIVKGKVRLLLVTKDVEKVKKGDVIVAIMTFPHFIAAMEKAAAFVTDEGGILCHAAIVAREMRKPCVIGTKIATKVLKDGDRVEVNGDKGVVRKV